MNEFNSIVTALGPVFALIVIGYIMGRFSFPSLNFWPSAERFTYYFLFPTLLILNIGNASLPVSEIADVTLVLILLLIVGSISIGLISRIFEKDAPRLTSIFQGGIRFNTYVGLASASALFGEQGLVWGAVFLAVMIPLVNFASIACFSILLPENHLSLAKSVSLGIIKNPLILACLAGTLLNLSGIGIPSPVEPVMKLIAAMALPLGLLAVGVGLNLAALRSGGYALIATTIFKLMVYPMLFLALTLFFKLPTEAISVIFLFALLPTAPSAYILSKQLRGDASLMAAIITTQTLVAMISMPLMLMITDTHFN